MNETQVLAGRGVQEPQQHGIPCESHEVAWRSSSGPTCSVSTSTASSPGCARSIGAAAGTRRLATTYTPAGELSDSLMCERGRSPVCAVAATVGSQAVGRGVLHASTPSTRPAGSAIHAGRRHSDSGRVYRIHSTFTGDGHAWRRPEKTRFPVGVRSDTADKRPTSPRPV